MRFLPGLLLGLIGGFILGAAATALVLPEKGPSGEGPTALEAQRMARDLLTAQDDRAALRKQVDEFQHLAERMTQSFADLEKRFRAMEEEMRAREAAPHPAPTAAP